MASIVDVAKYILREKGECTTMKLQKLCYYAQGWTLAWDDEPLFDEDFQAWAGGPVCADLYSLHKGLFKLSDGFFGEHSDDVLSGSQKENIDIVLRDYGDMEPFELSDLTHQEIPWRSARVGVLPGERGHKVIDKETMRDYYAGLIRHEV